jgi:hypothetical protein
LSVIEVSYQENLFFELNGTVNARFSGEKAMRYALRATGNAEA